MSGQNLISNQTVETPTNLNKSFEITQPPDDSVSAMEFSPAALQQNFLIAGSWDNSVRCWEIEPSGQTVPKSMQSTTMPILDACWSDDGTKVFMASCDKQVKCWDLGSNQTVQVAAHDAPVKTCHWVKAPSYTCLMTGSWDKTLKFWDIRSPNPVITINLPERVYCADVDYPMAVIGTAYRRVLICKLEGTPEIVKTVESPLKYQHRCVAIFRDKEKQSPIGLALGSVEGRAAIHYLQPQNEKDNYTFKCHRTISSGTTNVQDIVYAVNDIKVHPIHGTLVTVGSDATYAYWDKDVRTKIKSSEVFDQPITKCCFNINGQIFAYSTGYDWSKGQEFYNPAKKPKIFLKPCFNDLKPKNSS